VEKEMSKVSLIRILVVVVVGAALSFLIYHAPAFLVKEENSPAVPRLQTGGTSVAHVIMENRWRTAYRQEKGIQVDYESTGSTKGLNNLLDGKYAIAFTHSPLTEVQKKQVQSKGIGVAYIPVVLCAVVPIYNVKELKDKAPLQFTADVLADIFLGKIDKWNDPALKKINEGVDLPDRKITVVHREDSSGTTFIFTDFLSGASETWREKFGKASSEVKWPVGVGEKRSERLAFNVARTEGAIGYVDMLHAINNHLSYGAVQNKDKSAFLHATPELITATVKGLADIPEDLTFKLTNLPGKESYPICGTIWAVCPQTMPAATQMETVDFLHWVLHDGQKFASKTSYAALPESLVERGDQKLKTIKAVQ
jgi:phosphate ABC transporter phosphate-binding protein